MVDSMGGILTKGLGGDCTALIIGPFRLKLAIEPIQPGTGGGGGSSVPPGWFQPLRRRYDEETCDPEEWRTVTLHIKFTDKQTITRQYVMPCDDVNRMVTLVGRINRIIDTVSIKFKQNVVVRFVRNVTVRNITTKNKDD